MDLSVETYDVVICGAGPAGAVCALWLHRLRPQLRLLVVEAQTQARPRPCGEFIAPAGLRLLEDAGIGDLRRHDNGLSALHLHAGAACLKLAFSAPGGDGIGMRREELAARLLQALSRAEVPVRLGQRVQQLSPTGAGWALSTSTLSLRTGMVVGADGRHSRVRRLAGLEAPVAYQRCALSGRIAGLRAGSRTRCGEMHCGPLGQIGVAPLGSGLANVNLLLAPRGEFLLKRIPAPQLLRLALHLTPSLRARSHGCTLSAVMATPSLPHRASSVIASGLALIGDAAGSWDPFTGDGITLAVAQGEALARCLATLAAGAAVPARSLQAYQRRWLALTRAKRSGILERVLPRRALSESLVHLLAGIPALGRLAAHYALPSHQ